MLDTGRGSSHSPPLSSSFVLVSLLVSHALALTTTNHVMKLNYEVCIIGKTCILVPYRKFEFIIVIALKNPFLLRDT
jgi:hypothetical protein